MGDVVALVRTVEDEAREELQKERNKEVKEKIKSQLKKIQNAKQVLKNLEHEYDVMLEEIKDTI